MKAKIYDVAREAGVSITTVSNAINGKGKISQKRRQQILDIMERLDYHPSVIASALTGKRTVVELIIEEIKEPGITRQHIVMQPELMVRASSVR